MGKISAVMTANTYFKRFDDGKIEDMVLLQLDMARHSKWFAECREKEDEIRAVKVKVELARGIERRLTSEGFYQLYWAGDGGMFVASSTDVHNYDFVIGAADAIFEVFDDWKKRHSDLRTNALDIRVSAHAAKVVAHKTPGYWTAFDLNWFSKNEREISIPGAFVITESVREYLKAERLRFHELKTAYQGGDIETKLYLDTEHIPGKFGHPLPRFLEDLAGELALDVEDQIGPSTQVGTRIGQALLLEGVDAPDVGLQVDLKLVVKSIEVALQSTENRVWKAIEHEKIRSISEESTGKGDLLKVCPLHFVYPLADFPIFRAEWKAEKFSRLWSFHELIRSSARRATWTRLAKDALDPQRRIPSIMGVHCVIVSEHDKEEAVLLSERNPKSGQVDYLPGAWSVSFEEQLQVTGEDSDRKAESPEDCMIRGLKEEFGITVRDRPAVLGMIFERPLLNLAFLGVIRLQMSYERIEKSWRHARDKNEHWQVVGLPLRPDIVKQCIKKNAFSANAVSLVQCKDRDLFRRATKHQFHSTSSLRLGTALWVSSWLGLSPSQ